MQIYAPAPSIAPQSEDALLSAFFGTQTDGYFVDIGAHDGRSYSNTRPLWERGWSGLLIEPSPRTYAQLLANYPDKSRLTFLNAAICSQDGPVDFYEHTDPERTGWHSLDPRWIATWQPGTAVKTTVKGMRFSSLHLPPKIDFLSVDTEGMDAVIIESMPSSVRPRLIMCEVDKHLVREKLEQVMEHKGYRFVWGTYLNSAYEKCGTA